MPGVEQGNLQRWAYKHFRSAQEALASKKWKKLAAEVAQLEEVGSISESLAGPLKDMQDQLAGLAEARCQEAEAAQGAGDWVKAVSDWREAIKYRPGWPKAAQALDANATAIQEESRALYLKGVDAYANSGNYKEAAKFWNDALVLTPKDVKVLDSLAKARAKLGAIEKLKNDQE
jgi:tetratricopeptide (TPR) repeat protein